MFVSAFVFALVELAAGQLVVVIGPDSLAMFVADKLLEATGVLDMARLFSVLDFVDVVVELGDARQNAEPDVEASPPKGQ